MTANRYNKLEVKLGNYIRIFEMRENYIGAFVIENRLFNVVGSTHAIDMLGERNISKYDILASIVSLGEELINYNNNGKHIIISNKDKECSTVFTIENHIVVLVTVLDKASMYTSNNALRETINLGNVV